MARPGQGDPDSDALRLRHALASANGQTSPRLSDLDDSERAGVESGRGMRISYPMCYLASSWFAVSAIVLLLAQTSFRAMRLQCERKNEAWFFRAI